MNNEAGQKRKEFTQKSKSALKKFWHDWFGDYNELIKKATTKKPKDVIKKALLGIKNGLWDLLKAPLIMFLWTFFGLFILFGIGALFCTPP